MSKEENYSERVDPSATMLIFQRGPIDNIRNLKSLCMQQSIHIDLIEV